MSAVSAASGIGLPPADRPPSELRSALLLVGAFALAGERAAWDSPRILRLPVAPRNPKRCSVQPVTRILEHDLWPEWEIRKRVLIHPDWQTKIARRLLSEPQLSLTVAEAGAGLEAAEDVRVPRHGPGPPETLTDTDYGNLLRVPDRRTTAAKRDYALLRVLGDCGLRSAELRGLRARDLRRPRANARHHRLYLRGKGGRAREVPVPEAVQQAFEALAQSASALSRRRAARRAAAVRAPRAPRR